jgi:CheY-like chemotaxis protein
MTPCRILVVDDCVDNLLLIQVLLEGEGYVVATAADAGEAMTSVRAQVPALILMDIQLPGMDGLELTRRLRQDPAFAAMPIVALTAYAMKGDAEKAHAAGCNGYITKPIDTRQFPAQVRQFLTESAPGISGAQEPLTRETPAPIS